MRCKTRVVLLAAIILCHIATARAQQKGQWVPGQFGLNAGVIPDPGLTYANVALNYSASQLKDSNGNRILQNITGTYSFWVDENIFYYVPKHKFLGGYFMPYVALNYANGELVANITGTSLSTGGGGSGFADMYVQPLNSRQFHISICESEKFDTAEKVKLTRCHSRMRVLGKE